MVKPMNNKRLEEPKNTPVLNTIKDFMTVIKILMVLVFVAYLFSGITLVKPDEIAIILRMGKLVGNTPAEQIHNPGWMFAFPKPFDKVEKIPRERDLEIVINELAPKKNIKKDDSGNISSIDPTVEGYCISGDENIYQTSLNVKYKITDPIKYRFNYSVSPNQIIKDFIVSEFTCVSCGFTINGLLTQDKEELSNQVLQNVQNKLNSIESGLTITYLGISQIGPPPFLSFDFDDVQSANVDKYQYINRAKSRQGVKTSEAEGEYQKKINDAEAYAEKTTAEATANAGKFLEMLKAYEHSPEEVSTDMKNKIIKKLIADSGNLIVFPNVEESKGNVTLMLGLNGSIVTKITTPDGYYEEDD